MINFTEENIELLNVMLKENEPSYTTFKALEEATEFSEVILKLQTKSVTNPKRPTERDALEEYGDMILRGFAELMRIFPDVHINTLLTEVCEHTEHKLENLRKWHNNKEYVGGL